MRVLALDPGDKVGYARADIADDGTWTDFTHGISPLRDMALAVYTASVPTGYDLIIQEDWRLYPHLAKTMIGSSFPSVQFIGAVRLCCWLSGTQLITQGARIKTMADKTMKVHRPDLHELVTRAGAHDDLHDLDAIRHMWHWTFNHRIVPNLKGAQ